MSDLDQRVRVTAFTFLDQQTQLHGETLPRSVLAQGFDFDGRRVPLDRDKHPGFALFDFNAPTALERHLAVARLTSVERLGWKAAAPREPKFYRQMNKVG
jgi:hypothetical protein